MGKHATASKARKKRYEDSRRQGMKFETVNLQDSHVFSSYNVRSMWCDYGDGIVTVGKVRRTSYLNGRKHAHPPFTHRTSHAKTIKDTPMG